MSGQVDELEVAMELLRGKGLNRASFARIILNKENIIPKDKDETRKLFDDVLALIKEEHGDNIYKDGHDHFLKEISVEGLQEVIVELKDKISTLKDEIAGLKGKVPQTEERKQWLYKKGKGEMFNISEVEEKLEDGWKDHPKNS